MSEDEGSAVAAAGVGFANPRKSLGSNSLGRPGGSEPTQRFSALQQQLLCAAIHFFHRHIRSDPDVLQRMEGNTMFRLFFEVQYHSNKPDLNRIFPESVHDSSALHVCSFILSILHQGIFSVSAFIVSVIYLSRFKESSHITLHACTWRPLFLTSLLLADKMWEDKPVRNSSLAKLFPVLSNLELNKMESEFLGEIRFNVLVKPDLFCSFCEKLLAEQVHLEIIHCVNQSEYAATLQADQSEAAIPLQKPVAKPKVEAEPITCRSCGDTGLDFTGKPCVCKHGQQAADVAPQSAPNGVASSGVSAMAPPATQLQQQHLYDGVAAPRAHSAGATIVGSRRSGIGSAAPVASEHPSQGQAAQQLAPPHVHQQQHLQSLMAMRASMGSVSGVSGGSSASAPKSGTAAHPLRSISVSRAGLGEVHPLHRNESMKKTPYMVNKAPEEPEKARQQPGPLVRRSLPAKTNPNAYAPLSRVPLQAGGIGGIGMGGVAGIRNVRELAPAGGGSNRSTSAGSTVNSSAAGAGVGARGCGSCGSQAVSSNCMVSGSVPQPTTRADNGLLMSEACGACGARASAAACSSGGSLAVSVLQESRSGRDAVPSLQLPGGSATTPSLGGGQMGARQMPQNSPRSPGIQSGNSYEPPPPQLQQQLASSQPQQNARTSVPRVLTPSATQNSNLQSRDTSPDIGRAPSHQIPTPSTSQQPSRASSAPRVTGIGMHGQQPPVAAMNASPQVGRSSIGGQASVLGVRPQPPQVVAYPSSPATRGNSPVPGFQMVGGVHMPINSGRGHHQMMLTGQPQMSFSCGAPQGVTNQQQRPGADYLSATRGRSPPPSTIALSATPCGQTGVRQPRAATPGVVVKGISAQYHPGVQRNSIGNPYMAHRGMA